MSATIETIRVTCDCEHCAEYAERKGYAFPLAADVNTRMAAACGITAKNAGRKSKTHGLVAGAFDPMLRELQRRNDTTQSVVKFGPWAVV